MIMERKNVVYDSPKVIANASAGELTFEINDWGELRISSKYSPETFVLIKNEIPTLFNLINNAESKKLNRQEIESVKDQILEVVDDKPVTLNNSILLDWAYRLEQVLKDKQNKMLKQLAKGGE